MFRYGSLKETYTVDIIEFTSRLISQYKNIPLKDARKEFINSPVYDYLCNPSKTFTEEGPQYFFECYKNYNKYGKIADDTAIYIEKVLSNK